MVVELTVRSRYVNETMPGSSPGSTNRLRVLPRCDHLTVLKVEASEVSNHSASTHVAI